MVHLVLGRGTSSSHIFAVERKEPSLQKETAYIAILYMIYTTFISVPQ